MTVCTSGRRGIAAVLGLDWVGMNCGETPEGALLIFAFDRSMMVRAMQP